MENGMAPVGMRRQATKAISTNHNAREVATIRVHALASSSRLDARSNIQATARP